MPQTKHSTPGAGVPKAAGSPLDASIRATMESRFHANFADVRVHTDANAARAAAGFDARAYAVGHHVVFGEGEYRPNTSDGSRLIAHELAHVLQQTSSGESSHAADAALEGDARRAADARTQPLLRSAIRPAFAKVTRKNVCIRPVHIADDDGSHSTTIPSVASAKRVWSKCCIDLQEKSAVTVKRTQYQTLDESPSDTPTAEEAALFHDAGASGGCISLFVANTFHQGTTTSKDVSGGGATYDAAAAEPKVVVVEGVHPSIVAHELGHALGNLPHGPAGTIMNVTASTHTQAEQEVVNKNICDKCYAFTGATTPAHGTNDCDMPT